MSVSVARNALTTALGVLVDQEEELGRIDAVVGDGDHGHGMVRGFRAAVAAEGETTTDYFVAAGRALADAAGGASGALWGVLLEAFGASLGGTNESTPSSVARGLRAGLEAVEEVGRARPGDKTLVDALDPFVIAFEGQSQTQDLPSVWRGALPAAVAGRDATIGMITRRGRAAALGEKSRGNVDPGAYSLCLILEAVAVSFGKEAADG